MHASKANVSVPNLVAASKPIQLLIQPSKVPFEANHVHTIVFQMQFTLSLLEHELLQQNNPHLLQIRWDKSEGGDWRNWYVFADGDIILKGTYEWAQEAFFTDAYKFYDECSKAISVISSKSNDEYGLLKKVQGLIDIAMDKDLHDRGYEQISQDKLKEFLAMHK